MRQTEPKGKGQEAEAKAGRIICAAFLLACAAASAATLRGVVLDAETREPVPYADIRAPNLDMGTSADSLGRFALDLPAGLKKLTVAAGRVGYADSRREDVPVSAPLTFYLRPEQLQLGGITVSAFRSPVPQSKSGPVWVLDNQMLQPHGRLSVAEALATTPSLFTKDYGNMTSIGLRGANAEQTQVMLDGVRLNTAQDNLTDLSGVALGLADRIEVVRGSNSALYGANSIGGLVSISTPVPERFGLALTGGLGSQGKRYLAFQHANRYERLGYVVAGGLNRTDRGFSYRDTLDSTRTRVNSDLSHEDLMFKGTYGTGSHGFSLLGEYGQTRRGEPGPTYWPSDSARMDDSRGIAHLGYDLVESDNASLEAKLYHHEFWRHFWNPDSFSPANDTHTTTVTGLTLKQSIHLERWATAVAGLEADQEAFRSTAIGVPKRTTGSGWLEARLAWLGLDITPMARFDWLRNEKPMPDSSVLLTNTRVLSPKLAVTWSGPRWLTVYASGSRSFRAPTFNELYWPKDQWTSGNPHLKPEWATSADLAATLGFGSHLNARVGGWYTRLTDLILWQPDSNYVFSPVNVDTATITGGELELATGFRHGGVVGTTTWMSSRAHGKDLIYRPRLTFSVFHWLSWDWVGLNWTVRHTGQRYTQSDNSDSLPAFLTFDLGASLNPHWGRLKPALRGGVRNLFDKQHEVMKGYPVPGRNWYAELELGL